MIQGLAPSDLQAALVGLKVSGCGRKGKHFWVEFGPSNPCLLLHLGEQQAPQTTSQAPYTASKLSCFKPPNPEPSLPLALKAHNLVEPFINGSPHPLQHPFPSPPPPPPGMTGSAVIKTPGGEVIAAKYER